MKTRLKVWWKMAVAMAMLWLCNEAWGVDLSTLPFWRQAAGFVLLFVFVTYVVEAAEADEQEA